MKSYTSYDNNGDFKKAVYEFKNEDEFLFFKTVLENSLSILEQEAKDIKNKINLYNYVKKYKSLTREEEEEYNILIENYEYFSKILKHED